MLWGVVKLLGRGRGRERYSTTILPFPCQCDWSRCGEAEEGNEEGGAGRDFCVFSDFVKLFFRLRKTLPSNTFCLFPVHSSLECWLVGLQTWWQLVSVPNWSKNILVLIGWNNIGRDQKGQIWQTPLGSGWGKQSLGESCQGVWIWRVPGWLAACWGAHRCYFKSWGHQGLAETWSTLDGGRVDLYGVSWKAT